MRHTTTEQMIQSTCPYCGVGCGVVASRQQHEAAAHAWQIKGDLTHPANQGRLCVKGSALASTLTTEQRLLRPMVDGKPSDWRDATATAASRLQQIIASHGPQSVAMYLSGQLLTEDYYVANKLLKGFIGSAHLDTNSRLCMASTVAGHKRAFGEDLVPGCYEDLELAQLVVLVGSNLAWAHPILFQRLQAAKQANPAQKWVVIDPRRTATADSADLFLPLRPGTDTTLFAGLLQYLAATDTLDPAFMAAHTEGLAAALSAGQRWQSLADVAAMCDVDEGLIRTFYQWFAAKPYTVTVFSQGVNQAQNGTDKVNAIINVHLATGRIGKPGACPFSVTGQPNAMGGREVGALANQLAGHLRFPAEQGHAEEWLALKQFWQAPALVQQPGYTAVDLFDAVHRGEIKAIWVMATNPVVSMPQADRVREALAQCELVIVSDIYQDTDTVALADIVFPAQGFSEKDGTVTNSERCISRQRRFAEAPGEARPDWQIICDVAKQLGFLHGFNFSQPAEIFREHAALTTLANGGRRALDLSALVNLSNLAYDQWQPKPWPFRQLDGQSRLFADGRFFTESGKAKFIPVSGESLPTLPKDPRPEWFVLNSGRLRDQWHTMTRTGKVPALMQHSAEPFVALHPADAARYQVADGDLVQLQNSQGRFLAKAQLTDAQRLGELFVPMHWTSQFASDSRCDVLYDSTVDPYSKQPALKSSHVWLEKVAIEQELVLLSRSGALLPRLTPWARVVSRIPHAHYHEYRLRLSPAELIRPERKAALMALVQSACESPEPALMEAPAPASNWLAAEWGDEWRFALCQGEMVQAMIFAHPTFVTLDHAWLSSCFSAPLTNAKRRQLLTGSAGGDVDNSALVCSCYQVRSQAICHAIDAGINSVQALQQQLRCGSGCGSCLPEIRELLKQTVAPQVIAQVEC